MGFEKENRIWCAIPVFNHGATVQAVAQACRAELKHVIVVDDGSTDVDVGALFRQTDIDVLRFPRNQGKGCALLAALHHVQARGARTLLTLDADGQHQPADIRALLPEIADQACALTDDELCNYAPGFAILCSRHETQYSRLFRS